MKQCTLIVKDEVNCKFEGLDLETRKILTKKFKFIDPALKYCTSVRLGRWDGSTNYFQMGGSTYVNLLAEILPIIDSKGYDIDLIDVREYNTAFNFEPVTEDTFAHKTWPKGHPIEGSPVKLRDYQVETINNFLANTQSIQEVATGAGKTLMTATLSYCCEAYGRTIVVVPNKSLVTQTEKDYINLGLDVGVYYGDRKEFGKTHTICTWQSLNGLFKNTRDGEAEITIQEFIEGVVCVMIDEAHQAKAAALKQLLTGVMGEIPIRWGLTGTVPKEDFNRIALTVSLGQVISHLSASELQDKGVLAQCHVNIIQLIDHAEFKDYQKELKFLLENKERIETIAKVIDEISKSGNTLVLVDRVAPGKALVAHLNGSVFVSGSTKATDRQTEYDDVAISDNKIIVATYGVAAVGINIPRIFNLVLIEPGKSFVRVIQSIGRGIRKADDKDFVNIWDITSNCKFARRHLSKRKAFYNDAKYPFTQEKLEWKK